MVICPDCGKEVPKSKFCKNCGAYIENIEEPVQIESDLTVPVIEDSSVEVEENPVQNPPEVIKNVKYCFRTILSSTIIYNTIYRKI